MKPDLIALTAQMDLRPGAPVVTIAQVERELGIDFPEDYVAFLREANGGEGTVGAEGYGSLYSVEELPAVNRASSELTQMQHLVIFGTDGAGEAFCFDAHGTVVMVPWIAASEDRAPQGSFTDFMKRLGAGTALG